MNKSTKTRLDQLLLDKALVDSRSKAQALIMAGSVLVNDKPETKAGTAIKDDAVIRLKEAPHPWVSRGGCKLVHAIEHFNLDPVGCVAIDVGASTGGFTDVLLQHGASEVYAVDVGHGQLAWSLRNDDRVVVLEKTNARHLTDAHIPQPIDWVVCDASFISLKTVLPASLTFLQPNGVLVALIKPQFEAGKADVGKGGVVRDSLIHQRVCDEIEGWLQDQNIWDIKGIIKSPITGPKGNIEFLIVAQKTQ